ncbi:hypothetical protein FN846DRAFT_691916 [Sphaerosporella brunnea]|uniref:Calcineurin-like phosphoesterase domain-containing protein n=1 Tax=Sphaerosporella brunnea TaxID=1250544 RepID=A0A5J5EYP1_9PEZI|nr:hypothetical protein FN846DRAFT_691916 [Sphaerosporella brunnea]
MTAKGLFSIVLVDLLLPAAIVLNIYLHFYPILYGCAFPRSPSGAAPFRLLSLADPQIEGDTTLRKYDRLIPSTESLAALPLPQRIPAQAHTLGVKARKYGKMLDLWGNDLYLRHIYRTMKRHTFPTHVTVLGDLLGSQWIGDDEFFRRAERFWKIFEGAEGVGGADLARGLATGEWERKLIMMPGNHDVGYAGDISRPRLNRYEKAFGPYNYQLSFHPPENASFVTKPELRIAVLNSLTLDTPIWDQSLQDESYEFLEKLEKGWKEDPAQATLLLTHLPLHKPARICVDGPEITYFASHHGGGIKSQNFVSEDVSDKVKGWVFGRQSKGVIMTGHDHEGCQTVHFWDEEREAWGVRTWEGWNGDTKKVVREVTVRSMMGEYGGNAGLFSAWFDYENNEWVFEYTSCSLGVQHIWWTVQVVNVITAIWAAVLVLWHVVDFLIMIPAKKKTVPEEKKKQ